ncbi:hypothetical protein D3C78_1316520 [compost metagenome]
MPQANPPSPWRIPLVREIGIILLIKLAILMTIKVIWFSEPTVPENGSERVGAHLLGTPPQQPLSLNEEKPR